MQVLAARGGVDALQAGISPQGPLQQQQQQLQQQQPLHARVGGEPEQLEADLQGRASVALPLSTEASHARAAAVPAGGLGHGRKEEREEEEKEEGGEQGVAGPNGAGSAEQASREEGLCERWPGPRGPPAAVAGGAGVTGVVWEAKGEEDGNVGQQGAVSGGDQDSAGEEGQWGGEGGGGEAGAAAQGEWGGEGAGPSGASAVRVSVSCALCPGVRTFSGCLRVTFVCRVCHHETQLKEPFTHLSLQVSAGRAGRGAGAPVSMRLLLAELHGCARIAK